MEGIDAKETYEGINARDYDRMVGAYAEAGEAVQRLCTYAGTGSALELGVGTGRIAIPLAREGIQVTGVDSSADMLGQLSGLVEPSVSIEAIEGDIRELRLAREFRLVYCVFNTLFLLLTQSDQAKCFEVANRHLAGEGRFVVETSVPDLDSLINNRLVGVDGVSASSARLQVTEHDPASQSLTILTLWCENGQPMRVIPARVRYASPAELDLMAALAGLELESRWGGWSEEPFSGRGNVVSVYRHGPKGR